MIGIVLAILAFAAATEAPAVIHVTPTQAAEMLADKDLDILILDVRTRAEWRRGHIKGAKQINYFAPGFRRKLSTLPRDRALLVHCRTGHRSERTVRILKSHRSETIYHLDGGIVAWRQAGMDLVTETEGATE